MQVPQPLKAQVIRPTLHDRRPKRFWQDVLQIRQIFEDELILQVDRVRRHDDPLAVRNREVDRRNQVRHALASARPRLYHQPRPLVERVGDRAKHRDLWLTVLVARQLGFEQAPGAQDLGNFFDVDPMNGSRRLQGVFRSFGREQ